MHTRCVEVSVASISELEDLSHASFGGGCGAGAACFIDSPTDFFLRASSVAPKEPTGLLCGMPDGTLHVGVRDALSRAGGSSLVRGSSGGLDVGSSVDASSMFSQAVVRGDFGMVRTQAGVWATPLWNI